MSGIFNVAAIERAARHEAAKRRTAAWWADRVKNWPEYIRTYRYAEPWPIPEAAMAAAILAGDAGLTAIGAEAVGLLELRWFAFAGPVTGVLDEDEHWTLLRGFPAADGGRVYPVPGYYCAECRTYFFSASPDDWRGHDCAGGRP